MTSSWGVRGISVWLGHEVRRSGDTTSWCKASRLVFGAGTTHVIADFLHVGTMSAPERAEVSDPGGEKHVKVLGPLRFASHITARGLSGFV
jgi:hypothetical protein